MNAPLILASTSTYRRALLERLGLPFTAQRPDCDEDAAKAEGHAPAALADLLARRKAGSVASLHPDAVVIGSDQLVDLDGEVLGKPGTAAAAVAQLQRLAGRPHTLRTAVSVWSAGREVRRHHDATVLHMRDLGSEALTRYVAADLPLDCAGSYKLECRGIALFTRIDSADHTAITGLPLLWLSGVLADLGYPLP